MDKVVQGTWKGRTFGRRRRALPEYNNGIKDRDVQGQLRLRKERTTATASEDEAGDTRYV
jgi:hypothetical protein